jgi:hypothetical protein
MSTQKTWTPERVREITSWRNANPTPKGKPATMADAAKHFGLPVSAIYSGFYAVERRAKKKPKTTRRARSARTASYPPAVHGTANGHKYIDLESGPALHVEARTAPQATTIQAKDQMIAVAFVPMSELKKMIGGAQ